MSFQFSALSFQLRFPGSVPVSNISDSDFGFVSDFGFRISDFNLPP